MKWQEDPFLLYRSMLITKLRRRSLGKRDTIWFRPIRKLLDDGVPAMPITYLTIELDKQRVYPIGALCKTLNNRLIYWPLQTSKSVSVIEKYEQVDHMTLELASGRSHRTGYEDQTSWHDDRESKIVPIENQPMSFWFANGVDWNTIRHEPLLAEAWMQTPNTDKERRISEFTNFAKQAVFVRLPHQSKPVGDYIFLSYFYIVHGQIDTAKIPNPIFPSVKNLFSDCEDKTIYFQGLRMMIGDVGLVWACAWISGSIPGSTLMVPRLEN